MRFPYSSQGHLHSVTPLLVALFLALHQLQHTLASPLNLDAALSFDLEELAPAFDFIVVGGGTGELEGCSRAGTCRGEEREQRADLPPQSWTCCRLSSRQQSQQHGPRHRGWLEPRG